MNLISNRTMLLILIAALFQSCGSNYSPSLLTQIKFMDDAMRFATESVMLQNGLIERRIEKTVVEMGSRAPDLAILAKAGAVRKEGAEVLMVIDKLRQELIQGTGGYTEGDPRKLYKGASDVSFTKGVMIGQQKGKMLKNELDQYIDHINMISGRKGKFHYLALDVKDDPRISAMADNNLDFASYYFKNTAMVQVLAKLSELEFEIMKVEKNSLEELASEIGAACL